MKSMIEYLVLPDDCPIYDEKVIKTLNFTFTHTDYEFPFTLKIKGGNDVIISCPRYITKSKELKSDDKRFLHLENMCILKDFVPETPQDKVFGLNLPLSGEIKSVKEEKARYNELKTKYDGLNIIYSIFGFVIGIIIFFAYIIEKNKKIDWIRDPANIFIGIIVGSIFTVYAQSYMDLYAIYTKESSLLFLKPFGFCLGGLVLGIALGYLLYSIYKKFVHKKKSKEKKDKKQKSKR